MYFKKTQVSTMISAALLVAASQAQAMDLTDLNTKVNNKRIHQSSIEHSIHKDIVATKTQQKSNKKSFNWNSKPRQHVPLNNVQPLKLQYTNTLQDYFLQIAAQHGARKNEISQSEMMSIHDTGRGGIIGSFQQKFDELDVFGQRINLIINRKNQFIASSGEFISPSEINKQFSLDEDAALRIGFKNNTNLSLDSSISINKASNDFVAVQNKAAVNGFSLTENSRVKPVMFPLNEQTLTSAYYVEIETTESGKRSSTWMSYVIDANSGKTLFKNNLVSHVATTYKVFAESDMVPMDGPHGNDLTPHQADDSVNAGGYAETPVSENTITLDYLPSLSTQDPWLDASDTTTSGNNVNAYADISGEDGFDATDVAPAMSSNNAFEFDFGQYKDGTSGDGQKFAVVNLFYVNNFLHDWFYDSGFDEASGNAQRSNYGRGGAEGDALKVEAQDAGGVNNANMATPSDGNSPRMQMYLWNFLSNSGLEIDGVEEFSVGSAGFGPDEYDVNGVMIVAVDATAPEGDGCEALTTDVTGKIAIIDRGECNFTVKVKNAQEGGAIAALIVNDAPESDAERGGTIAMGGDDATITIPSFFLSLENGTIVKDALAANADLSARMVNESLPIDGTIDNGIVAHEWGHYLTNRLVGNAAGLSNNQGRSMGEGWGDFVALMMAVRAEDSAIVGNENYQGVYSAASYVGGSYRGIRRFPYTTNMDLNGLTFKHIENGVALPSGSAGNSNSEVHNSGEIWATVLWEFYVSLINKDGYTFAQAQTAMKDYLIASLKLTPNAPTFTEARDAVLAAAMAGNSEDFVLAKAAFAKRGMGPGAVAPSRDSSDHAGVTEDFSTGVDVTSSMALDIDSSQASSCDKDGVLDAGENAKVTLSFSNFSNKTIPSFTVTPSSDSDISFPATPVTVTGMNQFGDTASAEFEFTLNTAAHVDTTMISVSVDQIGDNAEDFGEPETISASIVTNYDLSATSASDDMSNPVTSQSDWATDISGSVDGFVIDDGSWYGPDSGAPGTSDLVTPVIQVGASGEFKISFDHFYYFEGSEYQDEFVNWDGGVIEISVNGSAWQDVVEFGATLEEPYNGIIADSTEALAGREGYVFTRDESSFYLAPNSITFADGVINNMDVQFRFRIGTDANTGDFGWLIDNIVVDNAATPMFSSVSTENGVCLSDNAPVVNAGTDIIVPKSSDEEVSVQLSGSASDADGNELAFQWTQLSGPTASFSNSTDLSPTITLDNPSEDSELIFKMTASDGDYSVSDYVSVVIETNAVPTVSATGMTVIEGEQATITASASDEDNDSLTYLWTQLSGPEVTLSSVTLSTATFIAPDVDSDTSLTFSVVASDGLVNSATAIATVNVTNKKKKSGSTSLFFLGLLGSLLMFRRKQK